MAKSTNESIEDSIQGQILRVLDLAASTHICKDKNSFDNLYKHGDYGYITVGNNDKLKVEDVGSVPLKLKNGVVRTFHNVKRVPSASVNLISLEELASHGRKYVEVHKWCKVYKGNQPILQGEKVKKNICHLIGYSVGTTNYSKTFTKKK